MLARQLERLFRVLNLVERFDVIGRLWSLSSTRKFFFCDMQVVFSRLAKLRSTTRTEKFGFNYFSFSAFNRFFFFRGAFFFFLPPPLASRSAISVTASSMVSASGFALFGMVALVSPSVT